MSTPRITPGGRAEIGLINAGLLAVAQRAMRLQSLNLFTTMARQHRMFRTWLRFGGSLMPFGSLPRRQTELIIVRVASLRSCSYELGHHRRLAARAKVSREEIDKLAQPLQASDWSPREYVMLRAADSLHERQDIDDELWAELATHLTPKQLVEFTMLVAHYEMLATFIGTLRIQDDQHIIQDDRHR